MDIDDELEMLQRELMAAQQQKTNPLSERTVAEIMVKLYHEGFSFYPTTDGNEYVTPAQLDQEILGLVRERGKINLSLMPQILNIGIDTIETRTLTILKNTSITKHGNSLISKHYFQQLIATLKQKLQIEGKVELEEIAIQHELNIQFIEQLITQHLHELKAELVHNQLRTKEYTLLKKAKVLGFLSALNSPISVEAFLRWSHLQKDSLEEMIVQLIKQQRLKGKYQGSYYIPTKFTANQNSMILQFYQNNGLIDFEMLSNKFLVSRPEEWVEKNIPKGYIRIQNICFKPQKLQSFASQIQALVKAEGFAQLSTVIPFDLQEKNMHQFIQSYCHFKDFFICEGFCYSSDWFQRIASEFKEKLIYSIFFRKGEAKQKPKKKGGKKQKAELLSEQELQEALFNCGFTDYSTAENLSPKLLPIIIERLELMHKKIQKQLAQNKGIITNNFLKYKSCKSIFRTEQSLARILNTIQKQQKKGERWVDSEFGRSDSDKNGLFGLIYYDGIIPKGWPSLQDIKWAESTSLQQSAAPCLNLCKKNHLGSLLDIINHLNSTHNMQIHTPDRNKPEDSLGPRVYQFFISQQERRLVLVDNLLATVDGRVLFSYGKYGLIQKAYAKLRYCYKGILGIGIQQLILQITGLGSTKYVNESEKDIETNAGVIEQQLLRGRVILLLGEGEADKKMIFDGKETGYESLKLYCMYSVEGKGVEIFPTENGQLLGLREVLQIFKNMIVIDV